MSRTVMVVGDGAVGKTTLCERISSSEHSGSNQLFDRFEVEITRGEDKKESTKVILLDTPGQDDFSHQRMGYYAESNCVMLCYSVICPSSFENCQKWVQEIKDCNPKASVALVATKIDLRADPQILSRLSDRGLSPVTRKQGKQLAKELHVPLFFEVSTEVVCSEPSDLPDLLLCLSGASLPSKKKKSSNCLII
eukprot:TRINITY_DN1984_c0_g1_i1.p1 TRINITY_DN1984_c0_g1~~TRINITY_DN1984_c0_g1_i1.p1  ORF type:complete len:210 (+),score=71.81 TRINITY_DN1984_c0_g1_i1:49-630(+)